MAAMTSGDGEDVSQTLKDKGNQAFQKGEYAQSIEFYTSAIDIKPNAILYSNRAFAYLKTEAFGLAKLDAEEAIKLDPNYVKGYYRLGSVHAVLGHYKEASKVFKKVCRLKPKDKDARRKLTECQKEVKRIAFEEAIQTEDTKPPSELLIPNQMAIPSTYDGPKLKNDTEVTLEFVEGLIEHFRNQKGIPKRYAIEILLQCNAMFRSLPTLIEIDIDEVITVCGDTHGQYYDLLNIFELNGKPSETNPYLFNGDFVDRGSFSLELVLTLFSYKLLYPNHFHVLRGNHETKNMNKIYGFTGEVKHKLNDQIMDLFTEVFQWLPLCATLNSKVIVMHGGLFKDDNVSLQDIKNIKRNMEPPEEGLMSDILWSDPQAFSGRGPSKRGIGHSFGPDITKAFLDYNKLELVVRSHEVRDEGYLIEHDGLLITVFSAPNYCDQMGNKGAFIRFKPDCKPEFTKFTAVPHPPMRPMAYASNMNMFGL